MLVGLAPPALRPVVARAQLEEVLGLVRERVLLEVSEPGRAVPLAPLLVVPE